MSKKIVVLGGGYAGVLTAKHLEKKIRKKKKTEEITVTLIDKNSYNTMLTELHEVAADRVPEVAIKMEFSKIFAKRNVEVVQDSIEKMDLENKKLVGKHKTYEYDYLVVATGSRQGFFGIEGAEENSFSLWSFDDAVKIKNQIRNKFKEATYEKDLEKRKDLLRFFVVGGGLSGVEMVGELAEWVPYLCDEFFINKEEVEVNLVELGDKILGILPEKIQQKSVKRLNKIGVNVLTSTKVCKVDKSYISLDSGAGQCIEHNTNTVIWAGGTQGSEVVQTSGAVAERSRGNRIETNKYLQYIKDENIYVVGDNMMYTPEGEERPVPQMVENCEHSAHTCAKNLMVDVLESGEKEEYKPKFHGTMLCIGSRYGQAYGGLPGKFVMYPSLLAMFAKHFINVIYFFQVLGFNKVWSYAKYEIFQTKNNRSFLGGYFANYTPSFWLVPLRVFLGLMWFSEGIVKFEKVLKDPQNIFMFEIPSADGVTQATETVAEVVSTGSSWVPQMFHTIETYALTGTPLPVPTMFDPMMEWSMINIIGPIAPWFQGFMIIAEMVIGLLLIAGLFTSIAAAGAAVMCVMIYMSGWSYKEIIWYFTASIGLIGFGGTGHTFSLDYYVQPMLKKFAKTKCKITKKWYLYND